MVVNRPRHAERQLRLHDPAKVFEYFRQNVLRRVTERDMMAVINAYQQAFRADTKRPRQRRKYVHVKKVSACSPPEYESGQR